VTDNLSTIIGRITRWDAVQQTNEQAAEATGIDYTPTWRENLDLWATCFAPGHKLWMRVSLWWHYNVQGYPKPPPLDQDPVYQRLFPQDHST
jgi:hypothetical protein